MDVEQNVKLLERKEGAIIFTTYRAFIKEDAINTNYFVTGLVIYSPYFDKILWQNYIARIVITLPPITPKKDFVLLRQMSDD